MAQVHAETSIADQLESSARSGPASQLIQGARNVPPAHWGVAIILLLMAYEWLISGLDKLFNQDYMHGLAGELQDSLPDNPNRWYVHFLNSVILPHATVVAAIVEVGELLVAVGLVAGALWWLTSGRLPARWSSLLFGGALAALAGSVVMTANYYLMDGQRLPWLKTGEPFDEGLGIDGLLTFVAVALIVVHLLARRQRAER